MGKSNQGLCTTRLYSEETSLTNQPKDLRSWLCNKLYPEKMVEEQLRRVEKRIRYGLLFTGSCIG